jgi:hypothetical protein
LSVIVLALVARHFGGPEWVVVPVLLSPAGYWLFRNGQTEWLILAGLLFFNGLDVLLITLKPQVALWVIVPRLRRAGSRWLMYLAPALVIGVASLVIWPGWPGHLLAFAPVLIGGEWNSSMWPWGLPVGLFCVWRAWQSRDDCWGVIASPLLFPYVNLPSYLGLLLVVAARWPRWFLLIWGLVLLGSLGLFFLPR